MTLKSIFGFLVMFIVLGIGIAALPTTVNAQAEKDNKQEKEREDDDEDEKLSPDDARQVKVSLDDARAIALKRVAGSVIDEELEKERGRLQYAFDIRDANGKMFDVEIDAVTGEVLQAEEEDEDDARTRRKAVKKKIVLTTVKVVKTKP